jgi:hypothetical protein
MPTKKTEIQQIDAITESARQLRSLYEFGKLPAYDNEMYIRPTASGCTLVSIDLERKPRRRAQQGKDVKWSAFKSGQEWKNDLVEYLKKKDSLIGTVRRKGGRVSCDSKDKPIVNKTRETPEKELQSFLIRDAINDKERKMRAIMNSCKEQNKPDLYFLTDELAFYDHSKDQDGEVKGKTVCDIIAIRKTGSHYVPVVMELKSSRDKERLVEQLKKAAEFVAKYSQEFQLLAGAFLGTQVKFAPEMKVEKWLIWPTPDNQKSYDVDPRRPDIISDGIRIVRYVGAPFNPSFLVDPPLELA